MPDLKELLKPPSETQRPSILEALREDEGRLEHNLKLLETWTSCQEHLPRGYDRNLLVTFLRSCKHDLQRAKKKLENYFVARTFDDVLYGNRKLTTEHDLKPTTYGYACHLPELTPEGCRIVVVGLWGANSESVFDIVAIMRCGLLIYDMRFHGDTLTAGDVFVFNGKHLTPGIIAKIFTAEFRRLLRLLQTAFPIRIRQMHVVNVNPMIVKFVNLVKQLLSEKLAKRVFIHSDLDGLYEEIPRRLLPKDFGGEQKSCREISAEWLTKVNESKEWFEELDGVRVTGSMPKEFREVFSDEYGAEGSFRKLDID